MRRKKYFDETGYPKRYELLGRNGVVLGIGVRWRKYQRIAWNLPFGEGAQWILCGKKTRLIKQKDSHHDKETRKETI